MRIKNSVLKGNYTFIFLLIVNMQLESFGQSLPDSMVFAASEDFKDPSLFKKIFFGSNYRKEWETEVKMPVFDLNTDKRGFKIDRMGGGHQTTSLYLKDENGKEWVLRSVDKKVKDDLVKGIFKMPFILATIQDLVSTAYPYGSLSLPALSNAAGVTAGEHHLYFVPDDPVFGEHRNDMANRAFILIDLHPTGENDLDTDEMLEKINKSNEYSVAQEKVLISRLLDWLIADWDRHAKQVHWLKKDSAGRKWFYPVPRDRDQAFAQSNGLFVKFAGRTVMPFLRGFGKKSTAIRQLSKNIDTLDMTLLNDLDRKEWENIIKKFQQDISDNVIKAAAKDQPKEIFKIRGEKIISKLKTRRNGLLKNAIKYYLFLAKKVTIKGTEGSEFFKIVYIDDKMTVSVYDYSNGDTATKIYDRIFYASETKFIYIDNADNDQVLKEGKENKIKLVLKRENRNNSYSSREKISARKE